MQHGQRIQQIQGEYTINEVRLTLGTVAVQYSPFERLSFHKNHLYLFLSFGSFSKKKWKFLPR